DLRLVNKRVFEALVKSGACDSLVGDAAANGQPSSLRQTRAQLFASIDRACEHGSRTPRDKDLGPEGLFGVSEDEVSGPVSVRLPDVPPWTEIEQLNYEKESLGLFWSGHPVDRYATDLHLYGARTTAELNIRKEPAPVPDEGEEGAASAAPVAQPPTRVAEDISIGGIVSALRPLKTRKGDRMCVFMLEDATGSVEVVVFPEAFKQYGHSASDNGQMVLVKGRFERDDDSARVLAAEI